MTLTLDIKPEIEAKLKEIANEEGKPVKEYAESIIERVVTGRRHVASYGMLKHLGDTVDEFNDEREEDRIRERRRWTTS